MDSADSRARQDFLEKSGLKDVDEKIMAAWGQARREKMVEIEVRGRSNLINQGLSPDSDGFDTLLAERTNAHKLEALDCWDEFKNKIAQMEADNQLSETDYQKWEDTIGSFGEKSKMDTGKEPSFNSRVNDFD